MKALQSHNHHIRFILCICIGLFLFSCSHTKWLSKHGEVACQYCPTKDTVTIVKTDSVVVKDSTSYIVPDTTAMELLFGCDSLNQVYLKEIKDLKTGKTTQTHIVFKDNILKITVLTDSIEVLNKLIEKYKTQTKEVIKWKTVTVEKPVGKFYIWFFWIFIILIVLCIAYLFIRWKFKSQIRSYDDFVKRIKKE